MPLAPGQTLGPYEIIEKAGAGGMGEVFKAKDTRLDRTVAIKVLPEMVAGNPDLKQRFEREAKTISSLNHPNICTLYDVGHDEGLEYIVMEFLEGETLSDRIGRGAIPMPELLMIAGQIADALDKAHAQGLIHRDLKPANVMLTANGAKLLDFGLAKLQISDGTPQGVSDVTRTTPLTGVGTILGTIQYMSPEQLEGKEADARSDIFAFGTMLYEMATGRRAFEGQSQASMIAGILERQPQSVTHVNPDTPPAFERIVQKCLKKDPESRWQSARDLADELRWISQAGSQVGLSPHVAARRKVRFRLGWGLAVVLGVVALAFALLWFTQETPSPRPIRFKIATRTDLSQVSWPCVSPDGQYLAFKARSPEGADMVWIRPMNSLEAYPLQGTEGANRPFWSPDSKYLAFVIGRNQLKKIPVGGGPAQLICETNGGADGTWGTQDFIIYDGGGGDSLHMVASSGGTPTALIDIDREAGETQHSWPWFLPDGRKYLYLADINDSAGFGSRYMLKVGDIETKEAVSLFGVDARVQYCEPGYLVYYRDGILLAQRFDPDNLDVIGEAVPLTDEVGVGEADRAEFGLSNQGTLAFQSSTVTDAAEIVWFNRKGEKVGSVGQPAAYENIALSPDETRMAYALFDGDQTDVWVHDLGRDVKTRVTFSEDNDGVPLWSPDGEMIYFSSNRSGRFAIYARSPNGMGEAKLVHGDSVLHCGAMSASSDGRYIYGVITQNNWDIARFDLQDNSKRELVVSTPYSEGTCAISPDGKYLAYSGNESDSYEIYVMEMAKGGGRWQISSGGGRMPVWSRDGKHLYYMSPSWDLVEVPISTSGKFTIGQPQVLFRQPLSTEGFGGSRYIPTSDPDRFGMLIRRTTTGGGQFTVVLNWPEEIQQK